MDKLVPTEDQEAEAFHRWLSAKGIPHTHIANESGRGRQAMLRTAKLKRQGQSKGVWDYEIFVPQLDGTLKEIRVELKRRKGGVVSAEQKIWGDIYERAGIPQKICRGWDEAREFTEKFLPEQYRRVQF